MTDLFRYIEQSFAVSPSKPNAIDLSDSTDFQTKVRSDLQSNKSREEIRGQAENFISANPVSDVSFIATSQQYLDLYKKLQALPSPTNRDVKDAIQIIFDSSPAELVFSDDFKKIKHFLNDLIVAVKMTSGFDKVPASDLVATRQAIALVEAIASREKAYATEDVKELLSRPVLVPSIFLKNLPPQPPTPTPVPPPSDDEQKRKALQKEYDSLQTTYRALLSLRRNELEIADVPEVDQSAVIAPKFIEHQEGAAKIQTGITRQSLTLNDKAINRLGAPVLKTLEGGFSDYRTTAYDELVSAVKERAHDIGSQLLVCDHVKSATRVYRLGINAFAVRPDPVIPAPAPGAAPDFKNVITRPIGIGNLQVVRQELLGYEAGEISHIENVLQGEVLKHHTIRKDSNDLTVIESTQTTQFDERDLQSTIRNEMSSETQKESGQQSTSVQDQTTTTSYGKLVENSKSNYAKSVTDRAVSSLTQQVSTQRIQREKRSFTERSAHEFDNSKGDKNVTGIYQWVDKKYKTRIVNYGKRLLYDIVVPEPAAFLIDSLQNAPQPEGLELIKPDVFDLCPGCINAFNYACLAAKYGVTGVVVPPPDDFVKTVAYKDASDKGPAQISGFGNDKVNGFFYKAATIDIPDGYKAIEGYCQLVRSNIGGSDNGQQHEIEFFIGKIYNNSLPNSISGHLATFGMHDETGTLPITFRSFANVYQYSFAIGINCMLKDEALEAWQLKTHAAIMNGYNRQLADYQDKLAKFQAVVRAQMAQAANYAHNPSIEQAELKKAFIYLLLSEHFNTTFKTTPDPLIIPTDPIYMKNWGALVAFFERAFEWENIMFTYYPYFWGRRARWGELILIQDISPQFEEFLKAGAARVVVPVRPGFENALAHYQETGDIWMGQEIPDMFSEQYVSIIQEIKSRNFAPGNEICVAEWDVKLPTTLVMLKENAELPQWKPTVNCPPLA